ncbi:MarR family winged helix-turn-helix transcriptional regulator [Clostridium aminobutyricum]|uniref:MarR family transcriptional regulator n=1 Tax=Clostridium aminobutyricum TaxID=33953 RepID=A0A939IK29_CLOAM|nr:MarR family transcriptional regulator [Clostridium aminobutyricum]MBN7774208.1 MarR family transcriptional regulator [Clostridium aminobutyricum]
MADEMKECDCKLDGCLFFSTAKLARVFGKIADDAFSKTGLSPSHALLLYLVNQEGGIPQKEIGELLHLMPSTITRFVEKLEQKKLVRKRNQGKNVYLCTTEKGLSMQDEIIKAWNNLNKKYKNILTEAETLQYILLSNKLLSEIENQED